MAGKINDELQAYETFLSKVEQSINQLIKPAATRNASLARQLAGAYAALKADLAAMDAAFEELKGYTDSKSIDTNKQLWKKVLKFFQGTGSSKALAEEFYDNITFKSESTGVGKAFHKTYRSKKKLVARLAKLEKARNSLSLQANKVIALSNETAVLGMAVFKARYYISGSLMNHSSMSGVDNRLKQKLDRAQAFLDDPTNAVDVRDQQKFTKRIDDVRAKHDAYQKKCRALSSAADVIQSSSDSIDFQPDWEQVQSVLRSRYKLTLRKLADLHRDADSHQVYTRTHSLRNQQPRISVNLPPGSLTPENNTPQLDEEAVQREEWYALTDGFSFKVGGVKQMLETFGRYLDEDHFKDYVDLDSDGMVLPRFNSWIQPSYSAIQPTLAAIRSMEDAFKEESADAFSSGREALSRQISAFDSGTRTAITNFKSVRSPFSSSDRSDEVMQNIQTIAARLENDHGNLIDALKGL